LRRGEGKPYEMPCSSSLSLRGCGVMPASKANPVMSLSPKLWMVLMYACSSLSASSSLPWLTSSARMRSCSSAAADSVKVTATIFSGATLPSITHRASCFWIV